MRIIFAGTPEFAAVHLKALIDDGNHQVVAAYTQPDRPAGRGKKLTASPVKQLAQGHELEVLQPLSLKDPEQQAILAAYNADIMVVVAYGLILPQAILDVPRLGCINVHASILPRWRGAAPIQRAIEAGDKETGVTIMQMDVGLDTGDMLHIVRCPITETETSTSLHDKLAAIGAPALLETLRQLEQHTASPKPQDDTLSCYAAKIEKHEALVDWHQDTVQIDRKVRAFNPFPAAYTTLEDQRIKLWGATPIGDSGNGAPGEIIRADNNGLLVSCGKGALLITHLQLPGKSRMPVSEALKSRAAFFACGKRLGN